MKDGNKTNKRPIRKTEDPGSSVFQLGGIFDLVDNAIISIDRDQNIVYFNAGAEKLFGYSAVEITGKPLDLLIPESFVKAHGRHIEGISRSPVPARYMNERSGLFGRRKDGTEFPAEASVSGLDLNGEIIFCVVLRDVTEREFSKDNIEEALSMVQATLEATPDGIIAKGRSGKITYVNRKLIDMWGIPESELETQDFNRVLAFVLSVVKDPEAVREKLRRMEENPGQAGSDVIELRDGRIFEQYCNPRILKGEVVGVVYSFRDVTENRRMVEELNRSIARLSGKSSHETIINEINRSISEYARVEDILEETVDRINRNIKGCDYVSIYFVEGNDAVLMAGRGYPGWFIERAGRIPYPRGFTWKAILDGNPILYCEDTDRDSELGPAGRELGTKSIVSMPIRIDGTIIGVLKVDSLTKNAFDDEDFKLLEIVSQLAERAIQKARVGEALRRSEERYRVLFDQSPVGVYIFDRNLTVTHCNKRMVEILQSTYEKVIGHNIRDLRDKNFLSATEQTLEGRYSYQEGLYQATTSLARVWLSQYFSPLYDDHGNVIGGIGVAEDITDRKRAEEALRENERMLSTLLSNLPGCSYRFRSDTNWTLDFISEGVYPLTGFTADEFLAPGTVTYSGIIHPDDRDRVRGEVRTALENRQQFDLVYRIITKSNEEKWVWDKGRGIHPADGGPAYIEGFVTDITESKRLEAQLRRAQKMEAIGNLAGGVAHDFNNLLTVISSYSNLLLEQGDIGDETRAGLVEIQRAGERAAALTNQLLALGRRQVFQLEILDLNRVISDLVRMFERLLPANIEIVTDLRSELWHVKADRGQLEQAIMNLLINAGDAMPGGGRLTLRTANAYLDDNSTERPGELKAGEYAVIDASDTGRGMDEQTMSRIFEPFFTTKDVGRGTGLGLATTFGIVSQSKGHITVTSEVGRGSTFRIYLPRADSGANPLKAEEPALRKIRGGSETVLLVEDESTVRTILSMVLKESGYKVIESRGSIEALQFCDQFAAPIDLLVTDVVMPGMNGPELVNKLLTNHAEMKVLYISGYTREAVLQSGAKGQVFGYLAKPFTPPTFLRRVREVLDATSSSASSVD